MAAASSFSVLPTAEFHRRHTLLVKPRHQTNNSPLSPTIINRHHHHQSFWLSKPNRNLTHLQPLFSTSPSSDLSSPSPPPPPVENPHPTGRFLTSEELELVRFLQNFTYESDLPSGYVRVRVMTSEELNITSALLAESFNEAMVWPSGYLTLLRFLVKNYLIERRNKLPHAVTLLGFYRDDTSAEEDERELAGTVEVSFDNRGANAAPPTPTPPKNRPYVCNMAVKMPLRRRGIGWHLLKASEQLISQMSSSAEVYLHCRLIDYAPLSMYKKAGYEIVNTDNVLVLLRLQRRKHLMRKNLLLTDSGDAVPDSEEEDSLFE